MAIALASATAAYGPTAAEPDTTESGAPIYRHEAKTRDWQDPQHGGRNLESVERHVEKHVGKVGRVFHEIASDKIHLDVLFVPATKERPFHTLVTSGVSDLAMNVPEGQSDYNRVELLMTLPASWPLSEEAFENEDNYWPVRWLKIIGRLPHDYDTWIGWGHTVPNGDPAQPVANTQFTGFMLAPAYRLGSDFFQLKAESKDTITFYRVIPLFQEEMDLKLKHGADALEALFEAYDTGHVVEPGRPNVALRAKKPTATK